MRPGWWLRCCLFGLILALAVIPFVFVSQLLPVASPQEERRQEPSDRLSDSDSTSIQNLRNITAEQGFKLINGPIFYNVYVPPDKPLRKHVKTILREQIQQRDWSAPNATIRYTLIGLSSSEESDEFQSHISSLCATASTADCQLESQLSEGNEEHTLRKLWEYCRDDVLSSSPQEDVLVTYIHDKGSFHLTDANEKARRMATKAAMECRTEMPAASNPRYCNICMGAFHVFPQYLASAK